MKRFALPAGVLLVCVLALAPAALAQAAGAAPENVQTRGFFDFIKAGGVVGFVILALSVFSAGLVIDSFIHVRAAKLIPPAMAEQFLGLAKKGKFSELLLVARADSMLGRIVRAGLEQGHYGVAAIRQAMQEQGQLEVAKLNQRVGYIGFIASIGPMLGLLGTVIGMISSFNVLGQSKGAARPDELATGISLALVTTGEGLLLAIPLMFFHNHFRDRVQRLGQECSATCEQLLRVTAGVVENRAIRAAAGGTAAPAPARTEESAAPAVAAQE